MEIYCLSGLGVDRRAYDNIHLNNCELKHIDWIEPLIGESLPEYSLRLFEKNNIPEHYNLVGVSFGGMIAQEFAKIRKPNKLILISIVRGNHELPLLFRVAGNLGLHKLIPVRFLKTSNFLTYLIFGIKGRKEKTFLKRIIKETDGKFLIWAIHSIVKWKNNKHADAISVHGDKDRILPAKSPDKIVEGGGHFMIYNKGKIISRIIDEHLAEKE